MSKKVEYGVSNGKIFRVGDIVEFKKKPPDHIYKITKFVEEDFVTLTGIKDPKLSATARLSSLIKIEKPKQQKIIDTTENCDRCPNPNKNVVFGEGPIDAKIMLVGEAPGRNEDRLGRPFVGDAGKILNRILKEAGLDRKEIYITNVVKCRPVDEQNNNRKPTKDEITVCSLYLQKEIETINPKIICPMGGSALSYFFPDWSISQEHGKALGNLEVEGNIIIPLYHPAYGVYNSEHIPELIEDMKIVATTLEEISKIEQIKIESIPELKETAEYIKRATGHPTGPSTSCLRCKRPLIATRSVSCGYGPVCHIKLFGKPQPLTEEEKVKRSLRRTRQRTRQVPEIDLSQLTDARKWFSQTLQKVL